jgi:hypothetical protein
MDPELLKRFQHQIWIQCKFALTAYDELGARITQMTQIRSGPDPRYLELASLPHDELSARAVEISMEDSIYAWSSVQALLTAVANISKALWGQSGKLGPQRKPLRDSLGVADTSPLRPTSMRNNFDHFDDRLDIWWHASARHNYVDLSIGDVASAISGVPEEEMFRSYDPATGDVVFWGKRYNLPVIVDELKRVAPVALRAAIR